MDDLVKALRSGEQADMDGTLVKVSRQACEEAADAIEALKAKLRDMHRRAQAAEAALREPIEAAAPERRTLGRMLAVLDEIATAASGIARDIQIGPDDEGRDIYEMVLAIRDDARAALSEISALTGGRHD